MCEIKRNPALEECPVVIVYSSESRKLVLDWSPRLEGLQRNIPLQQAIARYGEVELLQADIPCYRAVFNKILDALEDISPLVEGPEMGCVYMGVDGLHLIYPDDDTLLRAIREVISETFTPQFGIAGNKFLAYLVAQRNTSKDVYQVLSGDDIFSFLEELPCDVLPVSLKSRSKLHYFGIHTLGQIATFPPGPLQSQFGPEGKRIWELARGIDDTPLYPRFMERTIDESTALLSVTVSLEVILMETELLLVRIFTNINRSGMGIYSLTLWTRTWNAEMWEHTIQFKEPAMDVKTAVARIKRILEDYPQPGPVEQVGIRVNRLGYPHGRQKSLFSDARAKEQLIEDIKQLELRLGNPQVYKVKEAEPWSRIPERRYVLTPTVR
jgi:DNA polymerase-4